MVLVFGFVVVGWLVCVWCLFHCCCCFLILFLKIIFIFKPQPFHLEKHGLFGTVSELRSSEVATEMQSAYYVVCYMQLCHYLMG